MYNHVPEPSYPERYITTDDMPTTPIAPNDLVSAVVGQLTAYSNVVPTKSADLISDLCKGFNQCIYLNKKGNDPITYIFSPKTGSAKSLSAKMYVSLLQQESSLIVVANVKDAISFCEDINKWSNNPGYARCTYKISDTNSDNKLRVDKKDLHRYRCIVISHSMFITAHVVSSVNHFKYYYTKSRDLIIIDERISLIQKHSITLEEIRGLLETIQIVQLKTGKNLSGTIDTINGVLKLIAISQEEMKKNKIDSLYCLSTNIVDINEKMFEVDFESAYTLLEDKSINFADILLPINLRKSAIADNEFRDRIKSILNAIEYLANDSFLFYSSGREFYLMRTSNILNQLGSCVVLDATATVNEVYNTATWHKSDSVKHVATTNPRTYKNFTIYKAIGYEQGKYSILGSNKSSEIRLIASQYLSIANSIIEENDKLLIICHKDFKSYLEMQYNGNNIVFTHWGNHVGKNDWSDCNKVMIIGWNYIPRIEHWANHINAIGSVLNACTEALSKGRKTQGIGNYQTTQLADDLVQAISRCSVRKTISKSGDCPISAAFLFYPDNSSGKEILRLVEEEFNDAVVKDWTPISCNCVANMSSNSNNIKIILDCLQALSVDNIDVNQAQIVEATGLSKAIVSRTVNHNEFLDGLNSLGYSKYTKGVSTFFRLC